MGKKERRRREQHAKKKRKGALIGMRSGFKNVAKSVAGTPEQSKKSGWKSSAITIALVLAAAGFLYYRRGGF